MILTVSEDCRILARMPHLTDEYLFYRPPGAPLKPGKVPPELAAEHQVVVGAFLIGLLAGLVLGFGAAWLAGGWMWAQ